MEIFVVRFLWLNFHRRLSQENFNLHEFQHTKIFTAKFKSLITRMESTFMSVDATLSKIHVWGKRAVGETWNFFGRPQTPVIVERDRHTVRYGYAVAFDNNWRIQ